MPPPPPASVAAAAAGPRARARLYASLLEHRQLQPHFLSSANAARICCVWAGVFTLSMVPSCSFHLARITPLGSIKNCARRGTLPVSPAPSEVLGQPEPCKQPPGSHSQKQAAAPRLPGAGGFLTGRNPLRIQSGIQEPEDS